MERLLPVLSEPDSQDGSFFLLHSQDGSGLEYSRPLRRDRSYEVGVVVLMTKSVVNKIAHGPISQLRRNAGQREGTVAIDAHRAVSYRIKGMSLVVETTPMPVLAYKGVCGRKGGTTTQGRLAFRLPRSVDCFPAYRSADARFRALPGADG